VIVLLFNSCGGSAHPRAVSNPAAVPAPRLLELFAEGHAAMLHFPRGIYSLAASDRIGYYYSAPGGLVRQTGTGPARHGGIFVSKRDRNKLRGYIYIGGGVTHVGDLSRTPHAFRD
jgi:hypothetical protein